MTSTDLPDLLASAVRRATGLTDAAPRPGQERLSRDIDQVLQQGEGHVVGNAPTGTGKGIAYLVPAARLALQGRRTVVSTESLGLQHQLVEKDFPVVASAVREATGQDLQVAVLKGWSNFVCLASAAEQARKQVGQDVLARAPEHGGPAHLRQGLDVLSREVAGSDPLVAWALSGDNTTGDKADYQHAMSADDWSRVSVSPAECAGSACPLFDLCFPAASRRQAAEADVVVTNHSMLAVQASKGAPVVVGSKSLGQVDAVVVDEAHALPSIVRQAGAVEVSASSVASVVRVLTRVVPEHDPECGQLVAQAKALSERLTQRIEKVAADAGGSGEKIPGDIDPLAGVGDQLQAWAKQAAALVSSVSGGDAASQMQARRDVARIRSLQDALAQVRRGDIGVARWVELPEEKSSGGFSPRVPTLQLSPVDVSGPLHHNVWTAPDPGGEPDEGAEPDHYDAGGSGVWEPPRRELPVVAVSATVPASFPRDAGLRAPAASYESPFAEAYESSLLYVPHAQGDVPELPVRTFGKRQSLDTAAHPNWAAGIMADLVEASGGRALVLSATAKAGRFYAQELRARARGRWRVLSQWDGHGKEATTNAWRQEETSVLVGTRSYMTGVDAPGPTCQLVIVDRVPRGAANVVDDARVEVLAQEMSEFRARDLVYAVDAAQLLAQAAGRLIRSTSDRGMVAVLDPRLLKTQKVKYPPSTRKIYKDALAHFTSRTASVCTASEFLASLTSSDTDQVKETAAA